MRRSSAEPFALARIVGRNGTRAAIFAVLAAVAGPALAQESGRAAATGSDSLSINGHDYQLFGIEGLAFNQSCFVDGRPLACGASAVRALQTLLDPVVVTCTPKGKAASGAALATCTTPEGDVALGLVQQGWALADPAEGSDYAAAEATARDAKVGAWQGTFQTPTDYHAGIAAIETEYGKRAADTGRTDAERELVAGRVPLSGLKTVEPEVIEAGASGDALAEHEARFSGFRPGYIGKASEPPAVFEWNKVAGVLEATRKKGIEAIEDSVAGVVWAELAARPSQTIDTDDADAFYAAIKSNSAKWMAAKRQPVLFVAARDVPLWMRDWFGGKPPAGAQITERRDWTGPDYVGTIDGVDVFVGGPAQPRASLLVPSDMLAGATYQRNAEGNVVALDVGADQDWLAHYKIGLRWLDDTVTWLAYPAMAAATPDG